MDYKEGDIIKVWLTTGDGKNIVYGEVLDRWNDFNIKIKTSSRSRAVFISRDSIIGLASDNEIREMISEQLKKEINGI